MSDRHDEISRGREGEGQELLADEPKPAADEPDADLEQARENVFDGWPTPALGDGPETTSDDPSLDEAVEVPDGADESGEPHAVEPFAADAEPEPEPTAEPAPEHAPGELAVPPGYSILEGEPNGSRRAVGVVVARFNSEITTRLLEHALDELERSGVDRDAITVMPVPGAFELPLAAMALAKTRRYAAVVALGCVVRGDTPHFEYIASEAASGLQLAALETGVPVAFGVLTLERADQAEERFSKGAEAVRTALEMADLFANLRAAAAR